MAIEAAVSQLANNRSGQRLSHIIVKVLIDGN
jgi:hypothetical protein